MASLVQCTASIGLVAISGKQSANSAKLIDGAFSACEIIRQDGGSGVMQFMIKKEKQSLGNAASDQELDQFLEEALSDELVLPVVSTNRQLAWH